MLSREKQLNCCFGRNLCCFVHSAECWTRNSNKELVTTAFGCCIVSVSVLGWGRVHIITKWAESEVWRGTAAAVVLVLERERFTISDEVRLLWRILGRDRNSSRLCWQFAVLCKS